MWTNFSNTYKITGLSKLRQPCKGDSQEHCGQSFPLGSLCSVHQGGAAGKTGRLLISRCFSASQVPVWSLPQTHTCWKIFHTNKSPLNKEKLKKAKCLISLQSFQCPEKQCNVLVSMRSSQSWLLTVKFTSWVCWKSSSSKHKSSYIFK